MEHSNAAMSQVQTAEIIELCSDEETSGKPDATDNRSCKTCVNCINFQCSSGVNLKPAPSFACAFYGVNPVKKRKRMICAKCFNTAMEHQEVQIESPILNVISMIF